MKQKETENDPYNSHIDTLVDMLATLNERVILDTSLSYLTKEKCDLIFEQFKILDRNIFDHKKNSIDSNDRLEQLVYIMAQLSKLNFDVEEAPVRDKYNHLDYFAFSLNMMRERLEERVNKLKRIEEVLDSFSDLYLITDLKGIILHANAVLTEQYQIPLDDLIGKHITHFFQSSAIKNNYSLDFARDRLVHGIKQGFIHNHQALITLRISAKVYTSDLKLEKGYCYKVEAMNSLLYKKNTINGVSELSNSQDSKTHNNVNFESINNEMKEIILSIRQTYTDKAVLNLTESAILNSVNSLLDKI